MTHIATQAIRRIYDIEKYDPIDIYGPKARPIQYDIKAFATSRNRDDERSEIVSDSIKAISDISKYFTFGIP